LFGLQKIYTTIFSFMQDMKLNLRVQKKFVYTYKSNFLLAVEGKLTYNMLQCSCFTRKFPHRRNKME